MGSAKFQYMAPLMGCIVRAKNRKSPFFGQQVKGKAKEAGIKKGLVMARKTS